MVSICKTLKDQCLYYHYVCPYPSFLWWVNIVLFGIDGSMFILLLSSSTVLCCHLSVIPDVGEELEARVISYALILQHCEGMDTTWWYAGCVWRASRWRPLKKLDGKCIWTTHEVSLLARSYIEVYCFNCLPVVSNICLESGEDVHVHYSIFLWWGFQHCSTNS